MQAPLGALYDRLLEAPTRALAARAHTSGLGFGFSQFAVFSVYALAFWYGGQLMRRGEMDFAQVLKACAHAARTLICKAMLTHHAHASHCLTGF